MSLSSSMPRAKWVWIVTLVLAVGLWVGGIPQAAGQGTRGRDKIEKLSPAERRWLEKEFKALRDLPPDEQQRVRKNLRRWMQLPEEKRAQLRERWKKWQQLAPEQRQRLTRLREVLRRLPPGERQRLREALRRASPEERQRLLEGLRQRHVPPLPPAEALKGGEGPQGVGKSPSPP